MLLQQKLVAHWDCRAKSQKDQPEKWVLRRAAIDTSLPQRTSTWASLAAHRAPEKGHDSTEGARPREI